MDTNTQTVEVLADNEHFHRQIAVGVAAFASTSTRAAHLRSANIAARQLREIADRIIALRTAEALCPLCGQYRFGQPCGCNPLAVPSYVARGVQS